MAALVFSERIEREARDAVTECHCRGLSGLGSFTGFRVGFTCAPPLPLSDEKSVLGISYETTALESCPLRTPSVKQVLEIRIGGALRALRRSST